MSAAEAEERSPGPKIVFIMGRGRSGSTILDNLLGQLDGYFSLGQINEVWEKASTGGLCGCGLALRECPVWTRALAAGERGGADGQLDGARLAAWQRRVLNQRTLGQLLRTPSGSRPARDDLEVYAEALGRLYDELARVGGAQVLIDSSKAASHGAILSRVPGITPYYLHLVRDPRAVAYSRQRQKTNPGGKMPTFGPIHSTRSWLKQNLKAHQVMRAVDPDRRTRIRYEDFVARPLHTLQGLARWLGEPAPPPSLVEGKRIWLSPNHTAAGNPSRFKTGSIELRADAEWLRAQKPGHRLAATCVALPLLLRYRYPVLPRPEDPLYRG